ncbi:MAG: sialidase family protein [bacterium]
MPRRPSLIALPALLACLSGAVPAAAQPGSRGPEVVTAEVTGPPHSTVETSVAIDPTDPDHIVGAALATLGDPRNRRITNFSYVSHDGGRSWMTVAMPNPEDRVHGDDAVVIDHRGTIHRTWIGFTGLRDEKALFPTTGIFLSRSADGGLTWSDPFPVIDHLNTIEPFEDKPYAGVDLASSSPHRGRLHVGWTRFTRYKSPSPADSSFIYYAYSPDGGETFTRPMRIPAEGGDALDGDDTVEGAVPAVGPDGSVHMAWSGPEGIYYARSPDGGDTWEHARVILDQPGGWDIGIEGLGRANGMPVTAVDVSDGPRRGTVYVNWADLRNNGGEDGDADVFVARSTDGGTSWSEPVRVHGDEVGNGADQFFTWMSVDPVDGSVNTVWYDRRHPEGLIEVFVGRSEDGGRTFTEQKVSTEPFPPAPGRFFGDYNGISAYGGRVAVLWTHSLPEANVLRSAVLDFSP